MFSSAQAETCYAWEKDFFNKKNLVVGTVTVKTHDIFNTKEKKENKQFHRVANKLHVITRESVIRQQLLFKAGDPLNSEKLESSERLLRTNNYIKDASIVPTMLCSNRVKIDVVTRDNWSLTPSISLSRSGGKKKQGISMKEQNLFGLGKELTFKYITKDERDIRMIRYIDPQFMNSRKHLTALLQNNSDGNGYLLDLNLPYYDLDSKKTWSVYTSRIRGHTSLYDHGEKVDKIGKDQKSHSVSYGWLDKKNKQRVTRFKVGWQYNQFNYFSPENNNNTEQVAPSITESYPWIEYENRKDVFIEKTNFKSMGRIEDIQIGENVKVAFGLLHKSLGSNNNYLKLSSEYSKAYEIGENKLFFLKMKGSSYLGKGPLEGETLDLQGFWYSLNEHGSNYHISGRFTASSNLKVGEQLTIGGTKEIEEKDDKVLRGYPFAYQSGNKRALITMEKQFHFDWYPFNLVKFGAVMFTDVGSAWGDTKKAKVLADIGVGLRLFPTRSSSGSSLHLDLAVPLIDRDKVDKYQLSIKISNYF